MYLKCNQCNIRSRAKYRTICTTCHNFNNREKNKKYKELHKKRYKIYMREYHYKRKYNISLDKYNEISLSQNGCCLFCKRKPKEGQRPLHVDHCHKTGKVRGLLCDKCNQYLGYIKEDIEVLERIKNYLVVKQPDVQEI